MKIPFLRHLWAFVPIALSMLFAETGRADITDVHSSTHIDGVAQVATAPDETHGDPNAARQEDNPPDEFDVTSYDKTTLAVAEKEGRRATGTATQRSHLTSSAASILFSSSNSTSARAQRTGEHLKDFNTGAGGSTTFTFSFSTVNGATYTLGGAVSVQTTGTTDSCDAQVLLTGSSDDGDDISLDFEAEDNSGTPRNVGISKSGTLKPGGYTLTIFALSTIGETQAESRSAANVTFSVNELPPAPPQPPAENVLRWNRSGGGTFAETVNWTPHQVPLKTTVEADTAIFPLAHTYAVNVGSAHTERLIVSRGFVKFLSSNYTVDALSLDSPSLIVTQGGTLSIVSGILRSRHTAIGADAGSSGKVLVGTVDAIWQNSGRLAVGSAGAGQLIISGAGTVTSAESVIGAGAFGRATVDGLNSEWQTGNFAVGLANDAELAISDGGKVTSDDAFVAFSTPLLPIEVTVDGVNDNGTASKWAMRKLVVGQTGLATVTITAGGEVDSDNSVNLGTLRTGTGDVAVIGSGGIPNRPSHLHAGTSVLVGDGGDGHLSIRSGGFVDCLGDIQIGLNAGTGFVQVLLFDFVSSSPSRLSTVGSLTLGAENGHGTLSIEPFGNVSCDFASVGVTQGSGEVILNGDVADQEVTRFNVTHDLSVGGVGFGVVEINDAVVVVGANAHVGPTGIVSGRHGRLRVAGTITVEDGGTLVSVLRANNTIALGSTLTPAAVSSGGFTIEGNLVHNGTIVAQVSGLPTPGLNEQLLVTGTATLGGKLVVQFINGFAPKMGNLLNLVSATGGIVGDFSDVEVHGLQTGAQFQLASLNGAYTATALNDTVALPTVSIILGTPSKKAYEKKRRPAVFIVSRKGSKTAPLNVTYTISGTAENGIDYTMLSGLVTIPAKKNSATIKLKPVDDAFAEPKETVRLTIVSGADYTRSLKSEAEVTIIDHSRLR